MSNVGGQFTAGASAVGYLYQARLALLLCIPHLNTGVEIDVSVERLDDVSFEKEGAAFDLLQTKHHIDRVAGLTDASEDVWKTLRVWSVAAKDDPSLPSRARLALVTTGAAPIGSAASLLRPAGAYAPGAKRDPKSANERLTEVAKTSTNKVLGPAFAAFLALSEPMRSALLSAVEVLDNQPLITDLDRELEHALRLVAPPGKAAAAREMLEGWWWPRVCAALMTCPTEPIAVALVEAKLDDIREMLKRDSLVAEFENAEPGEADYAGYDGFPFVQQLQAIGLGGNRVRFAKRDFYRAFSQRSKWTREHVVLDDEVEMFELRLVEEWQPRFEAMASREEKGPLFRLLQQITTADMLATARSEGAISETRQDQLNEGIYAYRNSIVHGKFGSAFTLRSQSVLIPDAAAGVWRDLLHDLAWAALQNLGSKA